jgi:hypothetical protein
VGTQGSQFDADKTVRLHVVSDPAVDNRWRLWASLPSACVSPSSTRLLPGARFGRAKAWMAGTSPAKTKSAGRFAPLFDSKIFLGQPCAKAGIQGAILRTRPLFKPGAGPGLPLFAGVTIAVTYGCDVG